jgi:hypothetical protein
VVVVTIPTWLPEALVVAFCTVLGVMVYEFAGAFAADPDRLDDLEDR